MATVLLSDKKKILWPSVTCLLLIVTTTNAKVKGYFKCTKPPKPVTCHAADLPTVQAGYFNCSGYSVRDRCNFSCNHGYYPSSSNKVVCEEKDRFKANWSDGDFQCSPITCYAADLPTVQAGYFNCSGYSVGDKCNLTCNHGYYPSSPKETVCERRDDFNGAWRRGNFQCSAITCLADDLPIVQSGYFKCSGYSVGNRCTLTCNHGYYPSSSKEKVCEEKNHFMGNWSDGNFQCFAMTCHAADLPSVQAGYFNCSGYYVGDKCNLTCNHGYYPSSSKETFCEKRDDFNGSWRGGNFQCSAIYCHAADLPTVQAGYYNCSGYSAGDKCNLICNHGYYPSSLNETFCEKRDDFKGNWRGENFQCSAIMCQEDDLPTVQDGIFNCSQGYSVGRSCYLQCNNGYYPPSSEVTVCEERENFKGNWSGGNFQCYDCSQWNEWDGKEYRFINSRQSREESRLLCENDRAQLVIMKDKAENDFLYKMLSHCSVGWVWIGLNDIETEGTWVWSDQTEASYTNWAENEPTNKHNYNCVLMDYQSGKWRDLTCTLDYRTLCERNN